MNLLTRCLSLQVIVRVDASKGKQPQGRVGVQHQRKTKFEQVQGQVPAQGSQGRFECRSSKGNVAAKALVITHRNGGGDSGHNPKVLIDHVTGIGRTRSRHGSHQESHGSKQDGCRKKSNLDYSHGVFYHDAQRRHGTNGGYHEHARENPHELPGGKVVFVSGPIRVVVVVTIVVVVGSILVRRVKDGRSVHKRRTRNTQQVYEK
mmetsp:Transcript_14915/g.28482  ORF Transcript_14915/g.28482 Transcript_14915/m.28482 type:complete len:205 (+) Transcript_14915:156-770(+)